jgi:cytochrome c oxidase cbb3-type subunit 4
MISGLITAVLLVLFVAGSIWVWRPAFVAEFDAAARLPLLEDGETKP